MTIADADDAIEYLRWWCEPETGHMRVQDHECVRVLLLAHDKLRADRDALMAGLLAAILPGLDADTAGRVREEIRRLGGAG